MNTEDRFSRTAMLFGEDALMRLKKARVAVFGIGGVGGYVTEALARSGIGTLDLIDNDKVSISNINRQIIALTSTIGRFKTDVARERVLDINPDAEVNVYRTFYMPDTSDQFDLSIYDYIIDAIDTVTGKIELIVNAKRAGARIISCMGAGNKLDPSGFIVSDVYSTSVCPLAKVMRRELKKRGIEGLKVVYSKEVPVTPDLKGIDTDPDGTVSGRHIPGSNAFVPAAAGLVLAGEVVRDIAGIRL
ncbi:MAG: tRNA threonylcarbamoyladenosine dehydratase [Lachnospiraceae bacterium]|nr:tRNA threonylcarbamoyladenosine dehydratase [Lachnospiraceae bacterium]